MPSYIFAHSWGVGWTEDYKTQYVDSKIRKYYLKVELISSLTFIFVIFH